MRSYRCLTTLVAPLMPLWLGLRRRKGKEDAARIKERFGFASRPRPPGALLWLHAASVGEANSVLPLIDLLRNRFPQLHLLMTTGTVTSAALMRERLPAQVIHQYVPIDTPQATARFIRHWKPDFAFWVESEVWPNLIREADARQCFMGLLNARMSKRSYASWRKHPKLIRFLLSRFDAVFAQSEQDAQRLRDLGAKDVICAGNMKFDAALLPCDELELLTLKHLLGDRPVWLAASTHPGEETLVAQAHRLLCATRPNLLTIIVPRHPERGGAIAETLGKEGWNAVRRAQRHPIAADTAIYIADTLGELGLFYRLCEIVFMGGSLVKHGGQNPLEPARLACALVTGAHTGNFADIYHAMEASQACLRAHNAAQLAAHIDLLLNHPGQRAALQTNARTWVETQGGATATIVETLAPAFETQRRTS